MEQKAQIDEILKQAWKVQYKMLGERAVDKIYTAVQKQQPLDQFLKTTTGGSSFDLHSTWQMLYEAVDFSVNALALYAIFKQKNEASPSKKEMLQLLYEARVENAYSRAVLAKLDVIVETILEKCDS